MRRFLVAFVAWGSLANAQHGDPRLAVPRLDAVRDGNASPANPGAVGTLPASSAVDLATYVAQRLEAHQPVNMSFIAGPPDGVKTYDKVFADALAVITNTSGTWGPTYAAGPHIIFPAAAHHYKFAKTQNLKIAVIIEGDSVAYSAAGEASVIEFPPDTTGFIVNTYKTYGNGTVTPTTGADGATFRDLTILGGGGTDRTAAGIWCRAACNAENVKVENFAGNNFQIVATLGAGGALEGQASGSQLLHCFAAGSGLYGLFVSGSDANTIKIYGLNVHTANAGAIVDQSLLGNVYYGVEVDAYNMINRTLVSYLGKVYQYIDGTPGSGVMITPGENNAIWYLLGATTNFPRLPAWSNTGTYVLGGAIWTGPAPNYSVFYAPYVEREIAVNHLGPASLVEAPIGGGFAATASTNIVGPQYGASLGFGTINGTGIGDFATPIVAGKPRVLYSQLGESGNLGTVLKTVDSAAWPTGIRLGKTGYNPAALDLSWYYGTHSYETLSGPNTALRFGRTATVPFVEDVQQLAIGVGTAARIVNYAATMPTVGSYAQGEIVFNNAPTVLGKVGSRYVITGWQRLTTGSGNRLNVDWIQMRTYTGQ